MSVCAITAEYNPFHSGHKYQIDEVKKSFDTIVIIMSGSFTQRGGAAILNKWDRAKSAVMCGASLVLELPAVFAVNTAERFAYGAISIINALGCVDAVSFGSECGDIKALTNAARQLAYEEKSVSDKLGKYLKEGMSYAAARTKAFDGIIGSELLSNPNNILAIEYIRHLILSESKTEPITLKRQGGGYHSESLSHSLASASAIRAALSEPEKIKPHMPPAAFDILQSADKYYLSNLDNAALFHIRSGKAENLKSALECTEGIENRIYRAAAENSSIEAVAQASSSKRTPVSKIRRIILSSMLGIDAPLSYRAPQYARVLAFDKKGQSLLSDIKKTSSLTLVTKPSRFEDEMLKKDILAADIHALCCENPKGRAAGSDFLRSPFVYEI